MPSFRRRDAVIDADRVEESTVEPESVTEAHQARALAEEAEAEAAEAEAMAAAAKARARAARLRRQALAADTAAKPEVGEDPATVEDAGDDVLTDSADAEPEVVDFETAETDDSAPVDGGVAPSRRRRIPRPGWKAAVATVVALATVALLGASGYMVWTHRGAEKLRQQNAEYAAAARQSVVTLMSLDFNKAEEDVQRIIDNSTGQFKTDFESQAADFVKVAQDSKVVTEVSVNSTAVESMSDDAAEVLVAASSRVTNTAGANQEPRTWRLSVSLEREDGQIKMAKVEFVP
ncbi:hypothetical protein [Mycolicibacterium austroafricanum]|uniref:hypothetical protein n=1 Tax=Mycolicibacterium austroafricanum TaxID=39687 RepID=UPI001CA35E93|nr:hypothetical protein [Mycolicibacterium austroafricanum]QZT61323.1 hypothetical protein JN085_20390 [Mycolicibacterium austroafricanum]